jgi:CRP-like cAMP-binding protein
MSESFIQIVNPTGAHEVEQTKLAPRRYDSLRGKLIGLLDNNKPNADKFLQFIGARLQERYSAISLLAKRKMTRTAADGLKELSERCDVVVNAFAD